MTQWTRNALALLYAVACAGSALWAVRSCFRMDQVQVSIGQGRLWLIAIDAQFIVAWEDAPVTLARPTFTSYDANGMRPALGSVWWGTKGIRPLGIGWNLTGSEDVRVILPLWLVTLLSAIAPARWWRARRRYEGAGFAVVPAAGSKMAE